MEALAGQRRAELESRESLESVVIDVLAVLLDENDPPETRETLDRLKAGGYSEAEAKRLIATVLGQEILDFLGPETGADMDRYVARLHRLPQISWK